MIIERQRGAPTVNQWVPKGGFDPWVEEEMVEDAREDEEGEEDKEEKEAQDDRGEEEALEIDVDMLEKLVEEERGGPGSHSLSCRISTHR